MFLNILYLQEKQNMFPYTSSLELTLSPDWLFHTHIKQIQSNLPMQSPVLKGHLFLVLSYKILYELNLFQEVTLSLKIPFSLSQRWTLNTGLTIYTQVSTVEKQTPPYNIIWVARVYIWAQLYQKSNIENITKF